MNRQPTIAVIGAGYWGKNLLRNFHELGAVKAICDTNISLGKERLNEYPSLSFIGNTDDIFSDPSIDAAVIATPAETHHALAKKAILSGKDVFVEKPLALTIEQGEELVALSMQKDRILMVGHILQYHNAVIRLKELIGQGELGKIEYVYSNRLSIGKIRTEENILWSFAPHDISTILMLLGEFPASVQAVGGEYLQNQIADVTMTTFEFKSGVKGHIFVSWLHPFKEQKLVVVGDRKMAVFDDVSNEKLFLYPHKIEWKERMPVASKAKAEIVPIEMEEPLRAECLHFLGCVRDHKQPRTDGHEGLQVLRVLHACQQSLNSQGQRIVFAGAAREEGRKGSVYVCQTNPSLLKTDARGGEIGRDNIKVHPTAEVDEGCKIGEGTQVWHFSHIMKGSVIGRNCRIGQNVVIGPNAVIGNNCKIQNNVSVYEGVTLEDDCFCGPSMVFTNVFNPRSAIPRMKELRKTLVKKGATIGANATIICGHTIGTYAFIGAGSVVTKDVPDFALAVGNPARVHGWMCPCGVKIEFKGEEGQCPDCAKRFIKQGDCVTINLS
ncbi:Gfo/Idh/MocA family oxidoreductase [bacterium]|nr:Gfo/Idh/MocA family oxidoreductase [bacterium]